MKSKHPNKHQPLALIVDDNLSIRLTISAALTKAGFETMEAENGKLALPLFEAHTPDIVLLDVDMPEMDGYEACAAMRRTPGGEGAQIIMVTGMDDTESTRRAFEAGANDLVSKPIDWDMLGHRSKYMLRAGQAFQEIVGQEGFVAKIIQAYLNASELVVSQIREAFASGDLDRLHRASHNLKSSSANVGALTLAEICKDLEKYCNENKSLPDNDHLISLIESEFAAIKKSLQREVELYGR